ncbi:6,7,8-trihydroxycoumarin synthase-like [Henckelia pumila]|uniref:6,7,8-trihydroxycoumarin synthase-like n=1 Tax=Henckelia pumila TaxID=405737 RepID=UPI003C6E7EA8
MFLLLITLLSIILAVLMNFSKAINLGKPKPARKLPPGPRPLPLIGNLHQFDKTKPHIYLWEVSKKYGPLACLKHGSTPTLVVSSAELAKEILKTHDLSFCSRPPVLGQQKLSYGGIDMAFAPFGDHWKKMRKVCVHNLFSPKQVASFRSIREDEVSRMVEKISDLGNSPANFSEIAMSIACNLICRVAFGRRYEDEEYREIRFDRLVMEAQESMVSFYFSDNFPGLRWLDELSGKLLRVNKNFKELDLFYQQLIDEHVNPGRIRVGGYEDIIDLMLHLKNQDSSSLDLTLEHIKALLLDLFVAGSDTVAAAIVWTMTALIKRPQLMKKAQTEIREIIGKCSKLVSEEDIKKLPYLRATVFESLRLYPPAPLLYRKQIMQAGECVLLNDYKVEPGTSVIINGWAISRDPEIWENPEEFVPERFMGDDQVFAARMGGLEMIPFGGGRRGCPGMGMGMVSIQVALANLLYSFDWSLPCGVKMNDVDTESIPGLTTHKKNALILVPCKYN